MAPVWGVVVYALLAAATIPLAQRGEPDLVFGRTGHPRPATSGPVSIGVVAGMGLGLTLVVLLALPADPLSDAGAVVATAVAGITAVLGGGPLAVAVLDLADPNTVPLNGPGPHRRSWWPPRLRSAPPNPSQSSLAGAGPMGTGPTGSGPVSGGPGGAGPTSSGATGAGSVSSAPVSSAPVSGGSVGGGSASSGSATSGPFGGGTLGSASMGAATATGGSAGGASSAAGAAGGGSTPQSPAGPADPRLLRGGFWIGLLERGAVMAAVLSGFPEGIALLLVVKGFGRFPELHNPPAAERFIIGTLVSILWACACAGAAMALMR